MLRKVVRWCIGLYLGWVLLVIFLVWPLLNILPHHMIREQLQREFHSELILFNPFTLTLEVRRGVLRDSDDTAMLSVEYLHANLGLASLWQRALLLQDVTVLGPRVHLVQRADGALNLLAMLPEGEQAAPQSPPGKPFPLRLEELYLSGGEVTLEDRTLSTPWRSGVHKLELRVSDLSTLAGERGHYRLDLEAREGGAIGAEGSLALGDASLAGDLEIDALQLAPAVRRADPLLPFSLSAGSLDLSSGFELDWQNELQARVEGGQITLREIAARPRDTGAWPDTHLRLQTLDLKALNLDLAEQRLGAESLALRGLDVSGWQEGEQISLLALLPAAEPESGDTAAKAEQPAETGEQAAGVDTWRASLEQLSLTEGRAHWRSPFTEPALTVAPISAEVRELEWPAEAASPLALNLRINQTATFSLDGEVDVGRGSGQLEASLQSLPLAWFAPNLPAALRAEIGDGHLGSEAQLTLQDFTPSRISLDGGIEDFLILIRGADNELTSWDQLAWQAVDIDLPQRQVTVGSVLLDGFSGRLHIDPQGRVNLTRVLAADDDTQAASGEREGAPDGGEQLAAQSEASPTETASDSTASGPDAEPASPDWQVAVPEIQVADSALDFMDESLPIRFRTVIGDLEGSITGFRLDPEARVVIDLDGAVDGYAPVSLSGHALPLRSPPDLELALNFRGIDMARLSPYSATYAGYAIERGTLTVDLNYQLEDSRLQGRNQVVISQLRLGEQVDSERALDLPLRLGIALLTDSRGVIDLDVPVSGDLNNPRFSLGSVIAGAFVNLLRQAVTAPFNLLASLVGSEADLRQVDFTAGSVDLDEHSAGKLGDLAAALQQRPALELIVSGQVNPKTDGRQLREARLRDELLAQGLSPADLEQRSEAWTAAIDQRYAALPATTASAEAEKPSTQARYRAVRDAVALPETALPALASERAAAVKRFLVNQAGIAPERITIDSADDSESGSSAAIMEVAA
jgi:hypothetical protein